jgi:hypothetical protein
MPSASSSAFAACRAGPATEAGFVGLEEDVLVTPQGCTFLSPFQRELLLVDEAR